MLLGILVTVSTWIFKRLGASGVDPSWAWALTVPLRFRSERACELGWEPRCPTAADVIARCDELVPYRWDARLARFVAWLVLASRTGGLAHRAGPPLELHVSVVGRGGGDLAIVRSPAGLHARAGLLRPPGAVLQLADHALAGLLLERGCERASVQRALLLAEGDPGGIDLLVQLVLDYQSGGWRVGLSGLVRALVVGR